MGYQDRPYFNSSEYTGNRPSIDFKSMSVVAKLIVINVVIVILDAFTPRTDSGHWLSDQMSLSSDVWRQPWMVWKFLTAGFAHAPIDVGSGFWHVLGNMLVLWFLGRPVEERLGKREFLKFYLIAIVVAFVGWMLVSLLRGDRHSVYGASGAVAAVIVLFIIMYPKEIIHFMGVLPIPAWALGVLLLVSDVWSSISRESQVAGEAHLTGAAFGAMYYYFHWNFGWLRTDSFKRLLKRRPKLRVHKEESAFDALQREGDAILDKINVQGEGSLTSKERRKLEEYSRQLRDRKHVD
jgi:membrane associated rhomboid family serine protease